jgi:hypothetical protein
MTETNGGKPYRPLRGNGPLVAPLPEAINGEWTNNGGAAVRRCTHKAKSGATTLSRPHNTPDGLSLVGGSRRTTRDGNDAIPGAHHSHKS